MAIVGSAQVLIRPTFSNMQKEIRRELEGMGEDVGAQAGERAGRSLGDRLATWGKRGAMVAGGAIAAVTGTALVKGFGRLQAIENAQAKMRGLGHDADTVRQIMDNALTSVRGTAFGLGEAATIAASAVAAGIEPGEKLAGHLTNVANTAAAAGVSMEEMGAVFNKAATQANGVQNDVISQLADRGIPIYQALADQMGVTAGEVFKLASQGKVDFETFSAAAQEAAGTVAEEMGGTLSGSFQNTLAALGRVGANLMSGVYPYFADFFQGAMDFLGPLEEKAVEVGEALGEWLSRGAEGVKTFIQEFRDGEGLGGRFADLLGRIRDGAKGLFDLLFSGDYTGALRNAFGWEEDEPIVGTLLAIRDAVISIATWITDTAIPAVVDFGQWLWSIRGWLMPIAGAVLGIVAAWKTYQTVMAVVRGVTLAFTAVQTALNVVLAMNPIGLIVLALVGLAAAFVTAWHRSETFRNVVTGAWEAIKSAAVAVWDWLKGAFDWLKDAFASVADWFSDRGDEISGVWRAIKDGIAAAWNWIDTNVFGPIKAGIQFVSDVWAVHTELMRRGWEVVREKLGKAWEWIDQRVFAPMRAGVQAVAQWFSDRGNDIQHVWQLIQIALRKAWIWIQVNVFTPIRQGVALVKMGFDAAKDGIGAAWDAIKSWLKSGWDWIDDHVFAPFRRGIDRLVEWVRTGKDNIGAAWDGIKALFAAPINWVIDNVWNGGIARVFNSVAEAIGVGTRLPEIANIDTGRSSARSRGGRSAGVVARARGGWTRPGWVLVGEEGPELVNFSAPGRVYTADETEKMLAGRSRNPLLGRVSPGNPPHGAGFGAWIGDRWEDIKSGARWVADGVRDAAGNVLHWVRGGLAKAAEVVLTPIRGLIDSTLGATGGRFGSLVGGVANSAIDHLMEWIRGNDEGAAPDAGGRQLRGAQPHVNNAAYALADAVGGIRMMQAFNQSMAGGHPRGLAVDFIDSVAKLNRLADVIVQTGGFDRFNYMAWQGRLWSPGRGWRPQGRGYGNDPFHRWHLHAEWYDNGGLLKPGMGVYANATGRPEPVLTGKQWNDISALAARGTGMPEYLVVRDIDGDLIGRMRVEADGRIDEHRRLEVWG